MAQPLTILYIAGAGRSGTTILERVLGTLPHTLASGETYRLFMDRGIPQKTCSCGQQLWDCSFWDGVLQQCFAGRDPHPVLQDILTLHHALDHSRHLPKLFLESLNPTLQQQLSRYRDHLRVLYQGLAQQTGARVLIDSSKVPSRAFVLAGIPEFEVHVIHVVRDVRALVYAWQKKMQYIPDSRWDIQRYTPLQTLGFWTTCNLFSECLAWKMPYLRIQYESFAQSPRQTVQTVIDRIPALQGESLNFVGQTNQIDLQPFHSIAGNPIRFESGLTKITLDETWKTHLDPATARRVTVMAAPLLKRYSYSLRFATHPQASPLRGSPQQVED
jgi:hypothetical protein